jgi:hypothetical protein
MANKPVDGLPLIAVERYNPNTGLWLHDHLLSRLFNRSPDKAVKAVKSYPKILRLMLREWYGDTLVSETVLKVKTAQAVIERVLPRENRLYLPATPALRPKKSSGVRIIRKVSPTV